MSALFDLDCEGVTSARLCGLKNEWYFGGYGVGIMERVVPLSLLLSSVCVRGIIIEVNAVKVNEFYYRSQNNLDPNVTGSAKAVKHFSPYMSHASTAI